MCIICIALDKDQITINQANEIYQKIKNDLSLEHTVEVGHRIWQESKYDNYELDFKLVENTDPLWIFDPDDMSD